MNVKEELGQSAIFEKVGCCADAMGLETYVVGGYVRDKFLKRESKDIDFVCLGSGIELAKQVAAGFDHPVPLAVFKNYGTAMIQWEGMELEFVGARKESYSPDSRKPIVDRGTLQEDLARRDFSINAMAVSINK